MYTHFTIIFVEIASSLCFSSYDIFQGFDMDQSNLETIDTMDEATKRIETTFSQISELNSTWFTNSINGSTKNSTIFSTYTTPTTPRIKPKEKCPEELPTNIGSYEVPTEKDIVIFTKDLLLSMFETYKKDAMSLLRDIKEVTRAAVAAIDTKCPYKNRAPYKQCVKHVSGQSESVTKNLVNSLEIEKMDIKALTDNTICSLSEMNKDPMPLVKILAQETAMLKFALPGYLRLLNSCSAHCAKSQANNYTKKPLHRMTDQELVIKHFLRNKNYIELIKDSRHSV